MVLHFVTLHYGILTIGTQDSFFPSSCFSGQNGMFSATEQNLTYNHSFSVRRSSTIQQEDILFWCIPCCQTVDLDQTEKRNNTISQMRLRSVFKMRISILNTATTEQMGQGIISFFVYIKSTNSYLNISSGIFQYRISVRLRLLPGCRKLPSFRRLRRLLVPYL